MTSYGIYNHVDKLQQELSNSMKKRKIYNIVAMDHQTWVFSMNKHDALTS